MIKFFRKIRLNLLNEGKTGRYFKYAIGEILLVVIGILIALQINNWNEKRNQSNTQNTIYRIIKDDLMNDISEFESFVKDFKDNRTPAFEAVFNKKLTLEDWQNNPNYFRTITGYEDMTISQRGLKLLNSIPDYSINEEDSLASRINKFYNTHIVEILIAETSLREEFKDTFLYFKDRPWFSSFVLNKQPVEEAIVFINNNTIAQNRINLYRFIYKIYINELKSFILNAETLVVEIDKHLNNKP